MPVKAVIDLGTNTFHLLIADVTGREIKILHRDRIYVRLAQDGIERIGAASFQRGISALHRFKEALAKYGLSDAKAFGTAALRTASNAPEFLEQARQETGLDVEVIDGVNEARWIYEGVKHAYPITERPVLIMDIGGGSVEFILAASEEIIWSGSFPVGVAVLFRRFHRADPIAAEAVRTLHNFLDEQCAPLLAAVSTWDPQVLVGASGTFEVLEAAYGIKDDDSPYALLPIINFHPLYEQVRRSDAQARSRIGWIPAERRDLIVVAFELIRWMLERHPFHEMATSHYAMKEGMLFGL